MRRSVILCLNLILGLIVVASADRSGAAPMAATPVPTCDASATAPSAPAATDGLAMIAGSVSVATSPVLRSVAGVPLPGAAARFDYQSLDPTTGRLYLAHMGAGQMVVFDTKRDRVAGVVSGLPGVTGVLAVPTLGRVYASVTGVHKVAVIDATRLAVVARLGSISFPDGLAFVPTAQRVFVSDESGGGELVIDARANRVVTTIDIGGEAGNTQYDSASGCILVAVQTKDQLVEIDPATDHIVRRADLDADCASPHGIALDPPHRLAFVACEDDAKLLVVDLSTMRVLATHAVGDDPDVLAFDPGWHRLYVAAESGAVTVFDEAGSDLRPIGTLTLPHAHTVAVDAATHRVYLPLQDVGGKPLLQIMVASPPSATAPTSSSPTP